MQMKKIKTKLKTKQFTLIELIIVIVVIGILAGMALPKFIGTTKDAKVSAMDQDLEVLEKAVTLYESDNDGAEPFIKDGSGNYAKVSITRQTLKDTLDAIGDDESSVYTLDMDSLKPYLERLKYTDPTTDTYLYSTKTGVAINEQGKIDSSGITHHILNGLSSTSGSGTTTAKPKITLMNNSYGAFASIVIRDNNDLYGTGNNYCGQLGDGTTNNAFSFNNISSITNQKFSKVSVGYYHSMAIGTDGELYAWGDNSKGEIGDGTADNKLHPTKITLASGVKPTQIVCGNRVSMAIGSDGELYGWGDNCTGQFNDGTTTNKSIPTKITLAAGVKPKQIACGDLHSTAIGDDGNIYTLGANGSGQLGKGTSDYSLHLVPTKITLPNGVKPTQISCGSFYSMIIGDDGNLYAWGGGYLGDGTANEQHTPEKITLPNGVKFSQISAGDIHAMAIGSDGNLYAWGSNDYGQLGDNTTTTRLIPTKITLATGVKPTQIVAGFWHSLAIGDNNKLYTWGSDNQGQLGTGPALNDSHTPTEIADLS